MQSGLTQNISMLARPTITIIASVVVMFIYSWQLTLLALLGSSVSAFISIYFSMKVRAMQREIQQQKAGMTVIAEESYQNIRTVKAFANEEEESRKFLVGNQKVFQSGKKKALITGL